MVAGSTAGLAARLSRGIEQLALHIPDSSQQQMLEYLHLLQRWNKTYNLTSITEPGQMVDLHLLDSLAVMPHLFGERILDVGSGAGLPGLVLAMSCPGQRFLLLDSNIKKTRFLSQAQMQLGIDNVSVLHRRVEQLGTEHCVDTVISRAFASLPRFIELTAPLVSRPGRLLAMKGRVAQQELSQTGTQRLALEVIRLEIPGVDAQRHLVQLEFVP